MVEHLGSRFEILERKVEGKEVDEKGKYILFPFVSNKTLLMRYKRLYFSLDGLALYRQ
jgi:hypothetical protein